MKNKTKLIFWIMTFFIFFTLESCEKDLFENAITSHNTNGKILFKEFSMKNANEATNSKLINAVRNVDNFLVKKQQYRLVYDSIRNFYYDDTQGIHMQKDSIHSYTFSINRPNSDGKIENLVYNSKSDGSFDAFIIKYDFTKEELAILSKTEIENRNVILSQIDFLNNTTTTTQSRPCFEVYIENPRFFRPSTGQYFDFSYMSRPCNDEGGGGGGYIPDTGTAGTGLSGTASSGNGTSSGNTSSGSGESGDAGDSGGGSNSTIVTVPLVNPQNDNGEIDVDLSNTPCESLQELANPNRGDGNVKANVDRLKAHVNSPNNNVELGFSAKRNLNPDGSMKYTNTDLTSVQNSQIEIPTHSSIIGAGHSHPFDAYPMFSFGDIKALLDIYNDASDGRKSEVYLLLVAKDQATGIVKTYALKVSNLAYLTDAVNTELTNPKFSTILDEKVKIDAIHLDQAKRYSNCSGNYEASFLSQFPNSGISLYSTNDTNLSCWNSLSLSSVLTVTSNPCN